MINIEHVLNTLNLQYTHESKGWTDVYHTAHCTVELVQRLHERGSRQYPELMHESVYINGSYVPVDSIKDIIELHHNL